MTMTAKQKQWRITHKEHKKRIDQEWLLNNKKRRRAIALASYHRRKKLKSTEQE